MKLFSKKSAEKAADESGMDKKITDDEMQTTKENVSEETVKKESVAEKKVKEETVEEEEDDLMKTIRKRNPKKKNKVIRRIIILVVIIALVIGGVVYINMNKPKGMPVTTITATRGDVEQTIKSSGTVATENEKTYYADVAAPIGKLGVKAGETVEDGAVLLTYNTEDLQLAKTKADLTASSTQKKEQEQLEEGAKNEVDFVNSTLAVNDYDGRIAELEAKIESVYCQINSRKKWNTTEGARLESEIADKQAEKASISDNQARKDELDDDIEDLQEEINSHNTLELEDYLRQGQDQLAKLKEKKADYDSTKKSSEKGILTGTQKSQIADEKQLAKVTAEEAAINLERASAGINALFGGIVTDCKVTEGAVTAPGTELFTIADTDNVKVVMKATKYDLESIVVGQKADITIAGHEYTGKVTRIDRMAMKSESGTTVINAEIHIDKPDDYIYLGIEAKLVIHVAEAKDAILLPVEVINSDDTGYYCYVVYSGVIERRDLKIGISSDTYTEVLDGIKEGDVVIKDTSMELIPGTAAISIPEDGGMGQTEVSADSVSAGSVSADSTSDNEVK